MKNIRIIAVAGSLALLTACGNTKSTTNEPNTTLSEQAPNRGRSNTQETSESGTVSTSRNETSRTQVTRTTAENDRRTITNRNNTATAQKAKMQRMYADLNMTEAQISSFERAWNSATTSSGSSDNAMNSFERTETQDKILKDVLDDAQFEEYQQWARDNAGSND